MKPAMKSGGNLHHFGDYPWEPFFVISEAPSVDNPGEGSAEREEMPPLPSLPGLSSLPGKTRRKPPVRAQVLESGGWGVFAVMLVLDPDQLPIRTVAMLIGLWMALLFLAGRVRDWEERS
ncbi:MAG: hypothetical protein SFU56_19445 [Capsulimonadales bacterium]|nr:hypothetical protein [Capsulimonadales bacterium]